MGELLDPADALDLILGSCGPLGSEMVALERAAGRTLSEDIVADGALPPFANSAMDGVAVRFSDLADAPITLPLTDLIAAGGTPEPLAPGHAALIATGAALPDGADTVVPLEDYRRGPRGVTIPAGVVRGAAVRSAGSDISVGATALGRGTRLEPGAGALLAALGVTHVPVARRPVVAILSTGSELVTPAEAPGPNQIRDANATALAWALTAYGAEARPLGIAPDEAGTLRDLLAAGLEADALVTSGGVSVGERDFVREALSLNGVREEFWGVALRPGKPCAFGTRGDTLVFGLPGNPASALVGMHMFVGPAVRALSGDECPRPRFEAALATGAWPTANARAHAVRCTLDHAMDALHARPTGDQGSHRIASLTLADAIALLRPGHAVRAGDPVRVLRLAR